jgi:hypothetical protein
MGLNYDTWKAELEHSIRKKGNEIINPRLSDAKSETSNSRSTESRTGTREKEGIVAWVMRGFGGGYEEYTYRVDVANTNRIYDALETLIDDLDDELKYNMRQVVHQSRQTLRKVIYRSYREAVGDKSVDSNLAETVIFKLINSFPEPEITLDRTIPDNLSAQGQLEGYSAERYIDRARDFMNTIKGKSKDAIRDFIRDTEQALNLDIVQHFTTTFENEFNELSRQIENKEATVEQLNSIIAELKAV